MPPLRRVAFATASKFQGMLWGGAAAAVCFAYVGAGAIKGSGAAAKR